ncbi:YicC family protein [Glaciecola sp. XM2]|uniref:YicC/YloC family endoribonuclease n=1 Tax=Glaciecola sp. XM2 TaxID=1914931 RepID=UPI001BDEE192|nr:YicC/YloC family endoribonuclease [Glaciecola sp. XM2]MBT1451507.1 YicC family protein [Glaciecola sp. XM2]
MIYSMTGFARVQTKADWGSAVWEIRSVNQRYLETHYRLPEQFRSLEPMLRERFRKRLQRGKVECALRISFNEANQGALTFQPALAQQLIEAAKQVQQAGADGSINPADILRWPGVIATQEADVDEMQKVMMDAFDEALTQFLAARQSEGESMAALIEQRLDGILTEVDKVSEQMPAVLEWQKDRIRTRFEEAQVTLEDTRVEQEMVLLAQKTDVAEELDRLKSHIKETQKIMKKGGAIGRRLDFMMQEFNREANTLGSKSINREVTQSAVEIKVLIEQMREQIQNIE